MIVLSYVKKGISITDTSIGSLAGFLMARATAYFLNSYLLREDIHAFISFACGQQLTYLGGLSVAGSDSNFNLVQERVWDYWRRWQRSENSGRRSEGEKNYVVD